MLHRAHIKKMSNGGLTTDHVKAPVLTIGQEVLKVDYEIFHRQVAHYLTK